MNTVTSGLVPTQRVVFEGHSFTSSHKNADYITPKQWHEYCNHNMTSQLIQNGYSIYLISHSMHTKTCINYSYTQQNPVHSFSYHHMQDKTEMHVQCIAIYNWNHNTCSYTFNISVMDV